MMKIITCIFFAIIVTVIRIQETHGDNVTILESKVKNGNPDVLTSNYWQLAFVKIDGKRVCTAFASVSHIFYTTATCVRKIYLISMSRNWNIANRIEVCNLYSCSSVSKVNAANDFPWNDVNEFNAMPNIIGNIGLIMLQENLFNANRSKLLTENYNLNYRKFKVVGWESSIVLVPGAEVPCETMVCELKQIDVDVITNEDCANDLDLPINGIPVNVKCIKIYDDNTFFDIQDLGAPVIYSDWTFGIISHVDKDNKIACMTVTYAIIANNDPKNYWGPWYDVQSR